MELKEFISKSLIAVTQGVEAANKEERRFRLTQQVHADGTSGQIIEFDVQILASQESNDKAKSGINIQVASIGGELNSSQVQQNTHRLKFNVFVSEK